MRGTSGFGLVGSTVSHTMSHRRLVGMEVDRTCKIIGTVHAALVNQVHAFIVWTRQQ